MMQVPSLRVLRNVRRVNVELPGRISIDAGPDVSHLPNMRSRFPDAPPHSTTAEALANIAGGSAGTVVGHGLIGLINTGSGNCFNSDPDTHIGLTNQNHWRQAIQTVTPRTVRRVMLFSCGTGANKDGAQLLFDLAQALDASVEAPNGDVWLDPETGELHLVEKAEFQLATPDMSEPPPIKDHVLIPVTAAAPSAYALLFEGGAFVEVPSRAIRGVHVEADGLPGHDGVVAQMMEGGDAARFAASVALNAPIVFGGQPATIVTGRMELRARVGGRDVLHEYLIHNNRLIEDVASPGVFYQFGAPGLVL